MVQALISDLPREIEENLPLLGPGQVAALEGPPGYGLTRVGLAELAHHARLGPVAYLDVRGWMSPLAAWEVGVPRERLVVVRCDDIVRWGRVAAALLDGVRALYAEVPGGVKDAALRKLGALARTRRTPLLLRPLRREVPQGIAHLRLQAREITWKGTEAGHGFLLGRTATYATSGKAVHGIPGTYELEDDGTDALRLVPGVGTAGSGRATG